MGNTCSANKGRIGEYNNRTQITQKDGMNSNSSEPPRKLQRKKRDISDDGKQNIQNINPNAQQKLIMESPSQVISNIIISDSKMGSIYEGKLISDKTKELEHSLTTIKNKKYRKSAS